MLLEIKPLLMEDMLHYCVGRILTALYNGSI